MVNKILNTIVEVVCWLSCIVYILVFNRYSCFIFIAFLMILYIYCYYNKYKEHLYYPILGLIICAIDSNMFFSKYIVNNFMIILIEFVENFFLILLIFYTNFFSIMFKILVNPNKSKKNHIKIDDLLKSIKKIYNSAYKNKSLIAFCISLYLTTEYLWILWFALNNIDTFIAVMYFRYSFYTFTIILLFAIHKMSK